MDHSISRIGQASAGVSTSVPVRTPKASQGVMKGHLLRAVVSAAERRERKCPEVAASAEPGVEIHSTHRYKMQQEQGQRHLRLQGKRQFHGQVPLRRLSLPSS